MDTKPKSPPQAAEWWSLLDAPWQAIFKAAIGIESEPTEKELVTILSLTQLNCRWNHLTSLEPLQALTGLQTLNCSSNPLTNLEPLHGLKSLKELDCRNNPSLSEAEIERFRKAVPTCEIKWGTGSDSPSEADYSDYIQTDYED